MGNLGTRQEGWCCTSSDIHWVGDLRGRRPRGVLEVSAMCVIRAATRTLLLTRRNFQSRLTQAVRRQGMRSIGFCGAILHDFVYQLPPYCWELYRGSMLHPFDAIGDSYVRMPVAQIYIHLSSSCLISSRCPHAHKRGPELCACLIYLVCRQTRSLIADTLSDRRNGNRAFVVVLYRDGT